MSLTLRHGVSHQQGDRGLDEEPTFHVDSVPPDRHLVRQVRAYLIFEVVEFCLPSERKAVFSFVGCYNNVLGKEAPYLNFHNFRERYGEVLLVIFQDLVGSEFFELASFSCGKEAEKKRKPTEQEIRQPIQKEGRTPSPSQDEPLVCSNQEGLLMAFPDIDEADGSLAHS
jgi:hypothetical protein